MKDQAPAGFRLLKPHEHRKAGDVYPDDGGPVPAVTVGWPINQDSILRPIDSAKREAAARRRFERRLSPTIRARARAGECLT